MTSLQKLILSHLLIGHYIVGNSKYGYRLLSPEKNCILRFHYNTLSVIKPFLRRSLSGQMFIDKMAVRRQRRNSWIKQQYISLNQKVAA
jgi:hypothetical protein